MSHLSVGRLARAKAELRLLAGIMPFLYILLLPFMDHWVPGPIGWDSVTLYDWQRIGAMTVLVSSVVTIGLLPGNTGNMPRGFFIGVMLVLGAGIVSTAVNDAGRWSTWREWANAALLLLAFWSVNSGFAGSDSARWQRLVTLCLAGSALLYVVVFFNVNYDNLFVPFYMGDGIFVPAFSNVRFFSDYQAFLFPFLIYLVSTLRGWRRNLSWGLAAVFFMLFFYTGSRVVVLGQVGAHLSLFCLLGRRHMPVFRRHLAAWAVGGLLFLVLSYGIPSLFAKEAIATAPLARWDLSLRDVLWKAAWQDILDHPLSGIAPGQLSRHLNAVAAAPHSAPLMIAAEWGIPVLLLAILGMVTLVVPFVRRLRLQAWHEGAPTSMQQIEFMSAAWLAFLALLLHSLVANVWVVPTSQLAMLLAGCLIYSCTRVERVPKPSMQLQVLRLMAVLICGGIGFILAHDSPRLPERNSDYLRCMRPTPFFSPRFWQQGWDIDRCPSSSEK